MTLVVDNRDSLKGQPGLHAFIVGVSHYRHLPGGSGEEGKKTYNLQQLDAGATSAFSLYKWLKRRSEHLAAPLATVRLLLSPSRDEKDLIDETVEPCIWDNFAEEANRWRDDASENNDDITLFYFAGHGIIRKNKRDSILLCDDFAQPRRGPLGRAVEFNNLCDGMAPPKDKERQRARKQFYFIDACREFPEQLKELESPGIAAIFENELSGVDNRSTPIFHAAISGSKAYASAIDRTLFCIALQDCLDGLAAAATPERDDGSVRWQISTFKLSKVLKTRIAALNKIYQTDQESELLGPTEDIPIHVLDHPPMVDGILKVIPEDAKSLIDVDVLDVHRKPVWQPSLQMPYPYQRSLVAGSYRVRSTVREPPKPPYIDRTTDPTLVEPPDFVLRARPSDD